jgi:hypothetical protein
VAYEVQVMGNVAFGCNCMAGLNDDPVCKHRAAFYLLIGAIDLCPEPDPPALGMLIDCPECCGCGVVYDRTLEPAGWLYPACTACGGLGVSGDRPAALQNTHARARLGLIHHAVGISSEKEPTWQKTATRTC